MTIPLSRTKLQRGGWAALTVGFGSMLAALVLGALTDDTWGVNVMMRTGYNREWWQVIGRLGFEIGMTGTAAVLVGGIIHRLIARTFLWIKRGA